jgi:hypothetical protein
MPTHSPQTADARSAEIYEALHPETKVGGDRRGSDRQVGELKQADCFTADTAKSTGQSERAIQRDAARGSIGDDLSDVKGTTERRGEPPAWCRPTPAAFLSRVLTWCLHGETAKEKRRHAAPIFDLFSVV